MEERKVLKNKHEAPGKPTKLRWLAKSNGNIQLGQNSLS